MILAAGFGTRLRPLTEHIPKPLIPLANRPLLAWTLDSVQRAGVKRLVINLHHLREMIPAVAKKFKPDHVDITWSREDTILGTGGALVKVKAFVKQGTFFLINGDIFSQVDLLQALEFHRANGFAATMVVRPLPDDCTFTPLQRDESGRLVSFKAIETKPKGSVSPCMFCGVHVLEPEILDYLPESGFSCVNDQGYTGMMKAGLDIGTFLYQGPWFDVGTPWRYLQASTALLSGSIRVPGFIAPTNGVLLDPDAVVSRKAELGPNVAIGSGCSIPDGAVVRSSILLPGTRIRQGDILDSCIASPDVMMHGINRQKS